MKEAFLVAAGDRCYRGGVMTGAVAVALVLFGLAPSAVARPVRVADALCVSWSGPPLLALAPEVREAYLAALVAVDLEFVEELRAAHERWAGAGSTGARESRHPALPQAGRRPRHARPVA